MMEGSPLMAVTTVRTVLVNRPPTSCRNTAVITPAGTPNRAAMPTCSRVPTMAWASPPVLLTPATGMTGTPLRSSTKRWALSRCQPLTTRNPIMKASGMASDIAPNPTATDNRRSLATSRPCSWRFTDQYRTRNRATVQTTKPKAPDSRVSW